MNRPRNLAAIDLLIVLVAFVGVFVYVFAASRSTDLGFPLDDSWIHQVYGRNLALRTEWAFVPGVPSAASTSPLYTVLLAIGYILRANPFAWAHGWGAVGLALTGLIAVRTARWLAPEIRYVGVLTGLAVVTSWHFVWSAAAGMETVLFCMFTLALLGWLWRRQPGVRYSVGLGVLGALTTMTRPEGIGLFGLCLFALLIGESGSRESLCRVLFVIALALLTFLVCLAPYLLLNLNLNGTLLPNTSAAKQAENAPLLAAPIWNRIADMVYPLVAGGQLLLIPGYLSVLITFRGALRRDRRAILLWVAPLWSVALILLYAWRLPAPYQHGRYVIPALAPFFLLGVVGLARLLMRRYRYSYGRVLAHSFALAALIGFPVFWIIGAGIYAKEVSLINGEMVLAARWIATNVPSGELLAVHDIGAVGYFAPRPLLDLAGLISPEIVPIITQPPEVVKLMEARGVRWLMVSPPQLPMLPGDSRLCPNFETPGEITPVHMTVYRLAWDGLCHK